MASLRVEALEVQANAAESSNDPSSTGLWLAAADAASEAGHCPAGYRSSGARTVTGYRAAAPRAMARGNGPLVPVEMKSWRCVFTKEERVSHRDRRTVRWNVKVLGAEP